MRRNWAMRLCWTLALGILSSDTGWVSSLETTLQRPGDIAHAHRSFQALHEKWCRAWGSHKVTDGHNFSGRRGDLETARVELQNAT